MITSSQTDVLSQHFGQARAIEILADAGFDAFDLSLFSMQKDGDVFNSPQYLDEAKHLRDVADRCGIRCNQAHAPFPSSKGEEPYDTVIFERIVRSMEIASVLGAKAIVVHPKQHLYYPMHVEELYTMNHAFYESLTPYCEKYGIQVAVENMFRNDSRRPVHIESTCARPSEFCAYVDSLDPRYFIACLDIGHAGLVGYDAAEMIRILGHDRLHALHVHDNRFMQDEHTLPGFGGINWEKITDALGQIDYDGELTLEADAFLLGIPEEVLPEASKLMQKMARYLADQVEKKRIKQ